MMVSFLRLLSLKTFYLGIIRTMVKLCSGKFSYFLLRRYRFKETKIAYSIRNCCYQKLCKNFGRNIKIGPGVFISYPEEISIGNNVSINEYCIISGYGGIEIGSDVSIAHGCSILSSSHPYEDPNIKIREGELIKKKVVIGNNVWIGAGVKILYGITISDGAVIGAGSVVNKDVSANSVYAGVPIKLIKNRFENNDV